MSDETIDKRPPRDVFCGWTMDDQYTCEGHLYGPGVAKDVPASRADHLEEAVRRVNAAREEKSRVDPTSLCTPRPVSLAEATDDELLQIMSQRGLLQNLAPPEHTDEPIGEVTPAQLAAMQATADKRKQEEKDREEADRQLIERQIAESNANAKAAAAKLTQAPMSTPPPPAPPPPPPPPGPLSNAGVK